MNIEKQIWDHLISNGLTPAGAAGLMGNLYAESGLKPNNLENLCEKRLDYKYTDESYTAAVDSGKINRKEFLNPLPGRQYGYGIAQWTSPNRKAGLYDLCKSRGVSIADLKTQLDWLMQELVVSYKKVLEVLRTSQSVCVASDYVLVHFECPADCGNTVRQTRAKYAQTYYEKFADGGNKMKRTAKKYIEVLKGWNGYSEANGKYRQIINLYNSHRPLARGYAVSYRDAWCDVTVSAAAIKADMVDLIGTECGVEEHVKIFQKLGIWKEDGRITPKPGYIIVYNWDCAKQPNDGYSDHIGVVVGVQSGTITVIEGNKEDAVGYRSIPVGWGYIRGYAAPKYDQDDTDSSGNSGQVPDKGTGSGQTGSSGTKLSAEPKWVGAATCNGLNVRTWAGAENPNIKSWPTLNKGNLVDVCDSIKATNGDTWYYIRIAGKIYGFVHSKYIRRQ